MTYTHQSGSFEAKPSSVQQIGRVNPANRNGTAWQVAPYICCCPLCCWLDYIIIDVDSEHYSWMVASSPSTDDTVPWMYIMTREQEVTDDMLEPLKATAAKAGWDMATAERVPQRCQLMEGGGGGLSGGV